MQLLITLLTIAGTFFFVAVTVPAWLRSAEGDYLSPTHPWQTTLGTFVLGVAWLFLLLAGIARLVWAYQRGAVWENPTVFHFPTGADYWGYFVPSLLSPWSLAEQLVPDAVPAIAMIGVGLLAVAVALMIWGVFTPRWKDMGSLISPWRFAVFQVLLWSLVICAILQTLVFVLPYGLMTVMYLVGFWPVVIALVLLAASGSAPIILHDKDGNRYKFTKE